MAPFDRIAEQRINEAIERGELDNLPGAGQPLSLEDDLLVPAELRAVYRVLKNGGFVPPEVEQWREMRQLQAEVSSAQRDNPDYQRALRKLALLSLRLAESRGTPISIERIYWPQVVQRLSDTD